MSWNQTEPCPLPRAIPCVVSFSFIQERRRLEEPETRERTWGCWSGDAHFYGCWVRGWCLTLRPSMCADTLHIVETIFLNMHFFSWHKLGGWEVGHALLVVIFFSSFWSLFFFPCARQSLMFKVPLPWPSAVSTFPCPLPDPTASQKRARWLCGVGYTCWRIFNASY